MCLRSEAAATVPLGGAEGAAAAQRRLAAGALHFRREPAKRASGAEPGTPVEPA